VVCLPGLNTTPDNVTHAIGVQAWATAARLRLAFAAPGGGDDTYWHPRRTGVDPMGYLVEEFVPMVEQRFGVGGARPRRATPGWSMGGLGALLVAQQHPELVSAAAAMSSAVFASYGAIDAGSFDSEADWQRYGLWAHLDGLTGVAVRVDCGSVDPFEPVARQLLRRIPGAVGLIGSGCHDDGFWRRTAPTQLRFLATHLS
jgi:pimeloyl-ACP methyl ester carboxylesterase